MLAHLSKKREKQLIRQVAGGEKFGETRHLPSPSLTVTLALMESVLVTEEGSRISPELDDLLDQVYVLSRTSTSDRPTLLPSQGIFAQIHDRPIARDVGTKKEQSVR